MILLLRSFSPPNPGRTFFTHRPTDCLAIVYPGRALLPDGDGHAVFDGPFRRSRGRTEFAKPSSDRALRLLIAGAEAIIHLQSPFWCARSANKRDQQPYVVLSCAQIPPAEVFGGSPREVQERNAKASITWFTRPSAPTLPSLDFVPSDPNHPS